MSDTTTTEPEASAQEPQQEVDWKAKAREWERRAKENKSAADELASLRDSQKTAEQRFEERLAEVEKRAIAAETNALRSGIAAKFGITPEDRDLFLNGTDEETLTAQAQRLAAREADRKKQGNVAPNEGKSKNSGGDERVAFVGDLFGSAD